MYDVSISSDLPHFWENACQNSSLLFFRETWRKCVEQIAFHKNFLYGTIRDEPAFLVTVFKRFGFNVAYLNFPIGVGSDLVNKELIDCIKNETRADLVRIIIDGFQACDLNSVKIICQPRIVIDDLYVWNSSKLASSIRRNLKRASVLDVRFSEQADVKDITAIYAQTIGRHGAVRRYNEAYFSQLIKAAGSCGDIVALSCFYQQRLRGFMVCAEHNGTTFYLHGGYDYTAQNLRPMDVLMNTSIAMAREKGSAHFDFLASPTEQTGLIKFKKKWGGIERTETTLDISGNSVAGRAYRFFVQRVVRKQLTENSPF